MKRGKLLFLLMSLAFAALIGQSLWAQKPPPRIYSSLPLNVQNRLVKEMRDFFPNVQFQWTQGGAFNLYSRFVKERQAGDGKIDILHIAYLPGWYAIAQQEWVLPKITEEQEAQKFSAPFKDKNASWVALRTPTVRVVYNSDKLKPEEIPRSWKDFTSKKWRNRIVLSDPRRSVSPLEFFYGHKDFGDTFLIGLLENRPLIVGTMSQALRFVQEGSRQITFAYDYAVLPQLRQGSPLKLATMNEGVPVIPEPVGMIKGGPNPIHAREILQFMLSQRGQAIIANTGLTYSGRADVDPPPGLAPLNRLKQLHVEGKILYEGRNRFLKLLAAHLRQ